MSYPNLPQIMHPNAISELTGKIYGTTEKDFWVLCHERKSYATALYASSGTANAARHLLRQHQVGSRKLCLETPFTNQARFAPRIGPVWQQTLGFPPGPHPDENSWKARFVDWAILEDVAFRQASSERLWWLIANGGGLASQLHLEPHATICSWIRQAFESRRQIVFNLVKSAKSCVHLSLDLWTASNGVHYIGVVGHFVDIQDEKRDVLLGMPRLVGPPSGENMALYVKGMIDQYGIGSKLGCFMLNHAESSDSCLEALATWFPMDTSRCRLQCVGRILNLVARAVTFGSDASKFEADVCGATDELSFEIWAKKGAIGKLYNLVISIRQTAQQRQALRRSQMQLDEDDAIFTLEIIVGGKAHWKPIYRLIIRAIELRGAIELYQSNWEGPNQYAAHHDPSKYFLSSTDWDELECFRDFLKPFDILEETVGGNATALGTEGGHGAVWETLKTMDYLFVRFRRAAESTRFEDSSNFKSAIVCGWMKLDDYYLKTDRTPVYRAALALHPWYGYDYFKRHWKIAMDKPRRYSDMQSAVRSMFEEYAQRAEVETEACVGLFREAPDKMKADLNDYNSFGRNPISFNIQRKTVQATSELDLFQMRPIYPQDLDAAGPLEWWNRHQLAYPVLYRMALDLFSIPGMSAECDHVFSQTKKNVHRRAKSASDRGNRSESTPEVLVAERTGSVAINDCGTIAGPRLAHIDI
ncbi:hypothetical protein NQ176_g716 [Zarea fungicola]|uniref:Uncharacterized protein n=1 Tax=Zarea fungicola TaxID=93591 RepID=A0ACC1NY93_9HYPO|nr:hypothetical protein NQ176_g716 [Lecanicillium fungicola]